MKSKKKSLKEPESIEIQVISTSISSEVIVKMSLKCYY